jgi:Icc-related predicted phosphoesterase
MQGGAKQTASSNVGERLQPLRDGADENAPRAGAGSIAPDSHAAANERLNAMPTPKSSTHVRFAAVGDIHVHKDSAGTLRGFFAQAADEADALLLCGDLTDYGTAEEAKVLAEELASVSIPIVAVLGNHDFESGTPEVVVEALTQAGVRVLDGSACEIEGVGIAGVKGFGGGFGRGSLGAWGEPAIKLFVQEALNEAMKLESALAKLRTRRRIAVLHYSPIVGTVQGEPAEIFPFLGSSRLEEPLLRYPIDAVFHGHAHRGTLQGRTINGVPVYNVAKPLLQRSRPDVPPFFLYEVPREPAEEDAVGAQGAPAGT